MIIAWGQPISTPLVRRRELLCASVMLICVMWWCTIIGNPLSPLIVTCLTPLVFLQLLERLRPDELGKLRRWIDIILLGNSTLAIAEQVFDIHPLPRLAGVLVYVGDPRSIGFIGHPLTSATVTGLMLIYLVISSLDDRLRGAVLARIVVHSIALVFFGGRVALATTGFLIVAYALFDGASAKSHLRSTPFAKRLAVVALIATAVSVLIVSGAADDVLDRFINDQGSASIRWSSLTIFMTLSPQQLLTGLSTGDQAVIANALGFRSIIESTWLAWIIGYGLIATFGLVIVLTVILRACLRRAERAHYYMTVMFLVTITSSLGLATKTQLLTWLVCIMVTTRGGERLVETPVRGGIPHRSAADHFTLSLPPNSTWR